MDSVCTSDREHATTTRQVKGFPRHERVMESRYISCDIRRRSTGFIDYDYYREVARRERDCAIKAFTKKSLGAFVKLFRHWRSDPGSAGIINAQRASL